MKLLEVTITPQSEFATPLRGDILFGHLAWQIAYHPYLVRGGIEGLVERYRSIPDLVVSSPLYRAPHHAATLIAERPPSCLFEGEQNKQIKRAKYIMLDEYLYARCVQDALCVGEDGANLGPQATTRTHVTVDRLGGSTQEDEDSETNPFAPFGESCLRYPESVVLLVLINPETLATDSVAFALENIGKNGYGKRAANGRGVFTVSGVEERPVPQTTAADWVMTLAPSVPSVGEAKRCLFEPILHTGRHSSHATNDSAPWKAPLRLAGTGAALQVADRSQIARGFCGTGISNLSKLHSGKTIHQGYAPVVPLIVSSAISERVVKFNGMRAA